ncbi:MAG: alpha/beta hydrolase family protein [Phycisphaerae bacterium]
MSRKLPGLVAVGCVGLCLLTMACNGRRPSSSSVAPAIPPGQPASGPGGRDYPHAKVISARFETGGDEYWLFQPADPEPDEAPVVVFLHGFGAVEPCPYGAWIQHIVRKGHIVIYPRYQASVLSSIAQMPDNALGAVQSALDRLGRDGPVRPRSDKMAWVGHSFGGMLAANLSAGSVGGALPPPAVLMLVEPGGTRNFEVASLAGLPVDTLALLILGDADDLVTEQDVQPFVTALSELPGGQAEMITIRSDLRGSTPLVADHFAPLAVDDGFGPAQADAGAGRRRREWRRRLQSTSLLTQALEQSDAPPDTLDFYGYWKLLDGLVDAVFRGRNREFALGNTDAQRFMGVRSDGTAVTPLQVQSLGP